MIKKTFSKQTKCGRFLKISKKKDNEEKSYFFDKILICPVGRLRELFSNISVVRKKIQSHPLLSDDPYVSPLSTSMQKNMKID